MYSRYIRNPPGTVERNTLTSLKLVHQYVYFHSGTLFQLKMPIKKVCGAQALPRKMENPNKPVR